jgi:hypothetical protein
MLKKFIFIALLGIELSICHAQTNSNIDAKKSSPYLLRSTLGTGGMSPVIVTPGGTFLVAQSIGQASVIGTYSKNNYTICQGFQQPLISAQIIKLDEADELKARIYPNPFKQSVYVLFDELIKNECKVSVYNLNGTILYSDTYPPVQQLNIPLESFAQGNYILKITSDKKLLISKIIKL